MMTMVEGCKFRRGCAPLYTKLSSHLLAVGESDNKHAGNRVYLSKKESSSKLPSRTCITFNARAQRSIELV